MKSRIAIVWIATAFLASCTGNVNLQTDDGGLLSDVPCGAPCFWGVTPGLTQAGDVREVLSERGVSEACSDTTAGSPDIECVFTGTGGYPYPKDGYAAIVFDPDGDKVAKIVFRPSGLVVLRDIIKKYGEPSHVLVWQASDPKQPEQDMYLLYDDILTQLLLSQRDVPILYLQPETHIDVVEYFSSREYADYLELTRASLRPWHGYGWYP